MAHYQLTSNVSLTLKPCRPAFNWFAGKTNRIALYSVRLGSFELDLYIARKWHYPPWEEATEYLDQSEFEVAVAQQTKAQPSLNH